MLLTFASRAHEQLKYDTFRKTFIILKSYEMHFFYNNHDTQDDV